MEHVLIGKWVNQCTLSLNQKFTQLCPPTVHTMPTNYVHRSGTNVLSTASPNQVLLHAPLFSFTIRLICRISHPILHRMASTLRNQILVFYSPLPNSVPTTGIVRTRNQARARTEVQAHVLLDSHFILPLFKLLSLLDNRGMFHRHLLV